ncbi:MAG: TRAP transporter substrate-binding protein DctP [Bacteriovoracaceae bacterium]
MKFALSLMFLLLSQSVFATTLKLAVLTPEGTTWSNSLRDMAKEIKNATNGEVELKIYYGGVAGDEPDALRKIRVGQLHGGIFTGKTLGEIYGDVRVVELPFTFKLDRARAYQTLTKLTPTFNAGFAKKGFKTLGFYEVGSIYLVTTKKASNMDELKGLKIWAWEGDQMVATMVDSLKLVSVPLALPDVLSSLSTGVIDAAYSSPLGVLALQWQTKIKYVVDFPVAYAIAAFLVADKEWSKIKPASQKIIEDIAHKYSEAANVTTVKENEDALASMKKMKIEFVKFPESDMKKGDGIRADVVSKLKGKLISEAAINQLNKEMGK